MTADSTQPRVVVASAVGLRAKTDKAVLVPARLVRQVAVDALQARTAASARRRRRGRR